LAHWQVFYEANEEREVLSDDLDDEHVSLRSPPRSNRLHLAWCMLHVACCHIGALQMYDDGEYETDAQPSTPITSKSRSASAVFDPSQPMVRRTVYVLRHAVGPTDRRTVVL
jgi:hypothetical protein